MYEKPLLGEELSKHIEKIREQCHSEAEAGHRIEGFEDYNIDCWFFHATAQEILASLTRTNRDEDVIAEQIADACRIKDRFTKRS